jgi:uncharacterized FlaG/YvyC family protein
MSSTTPIPNSVPEVAASAKTAQNPPRNQTTPSAPDSSSTDQALAAQVGSDLRLVIEEDKKAGSYIYMTVDPRTGKVLAQLPREQLLKMRETASYKAGSIINTSS